LHDFGARGVSSLESAGIGGAAHLVNFKGTDTVPALLWAKKYYGAEMAGFSIPAAEHSTITSWGRKNEVEAYRNMLNQFAKPGAIVAVVSDSYDVYNAAEKLWGEELRQQVVDSGATVVIRPDSGDPETVCAQLVEILGRKFGYTKNAKGYNVLNNVRLIQGDGVNINSIRCILANFKAHGWSADNIAFGMGGALLQKVDRDTQKFAMKCSAAYVNGAWIDVSKDPITDPDKKSKVGQVTTLKSEIGNTFDVVDKLDGKYEGWYNFMNLVYLNGSLISKIKFEEVRHNASNS
jgi:nicotinamide phosphoribosyltransferase